MPEQYFQRISPGAMKVGSEQVGDVTEVPEWFAPVPYIVVFLCLVLGAATVIRTLQGKTLF